MTEPLVGLRTTVSQNVLLCWWGDGARADEVKRAHTELHALSKLHGRVAMLSVIGEGVRLGAGVNDQVSREARSLMNARDVGLVASAVVYDADGFAASILRSIVSGLSLVTLAARPMRVFADAPTAEKWVIAQLGDDAKHRVGELVRAVAQGPR